MAIFKPETLKSGLFPTFFIYRFLGMGIIEYPVGHQRWILSFIYSSTVSILYAIAFFVSHDIVSRIGTLLGSTLANFVYHIFTSLSLVTIIADFVYYLAHNKKHNHCVKELMSIDAAIETMRAPRPYQSCSRQQVWHLLGSSFFASVTNIVPYYYITTVHPNAEMFEIFLLWYILVSPVFVSTFGDIAFCIFNGVMTQSFKDLNALLQSMRIKDPDNYDTRMGNLIRVDAILEDKEKLEKLRCIRKIYSRLVNLAKCWTELNGLHVVSCTIFAIWSGTIQAYAMYLVYERPRFGFPEGMTCARCLYFMIFHIVKLYMIVCPTTVLMTEARRTGGILLRDLQPIAFLRMEVNEFVMQLIQNPLHLLACGLFNLDYSLMQMVITSVATYSVVLVQTNGVQVSDNRPSIFPSSE